MKTSRIFVAMVAAGLWAPAGWSADMTPLGERRFQENMDSIQHERDGQQRARRADQLARVHWLSSQQVKAIALQLEDDDARLQFATLAYAHTVDPENFYDVYDAFKSFSRVMRLHDRIHRLERPGGPAPANVAPLTVTDEEAKGYVAALKKESFDQSRGQLARQIISGSPKPFLSAQIKAMLQCFDFEPPKLELAKYAYEFTLDRDKYYVVNDAFTFMNTKQELSRYIESRKPGKH